MVIRPFFSFYGSKWRIAKRYPKPEYDHIIEPFAGSAGYSLRYTEKQVTLYDADSTICSVWDYLISAPTSEIESLPIDVKHVDEVKGSQEAKWLIGFWLNHACVSPMLSPSAWMRKGKHNTSFWGEEIRNRIAKQQQFIRHWEIIEGKYDAATNHNATWFVDPPYQGKCGRLYKHNDIDFEVLGNWCQDRRGQVIVCESEGANWLDFRPFHEAKAMEGPRGKKISKEMIWTGEK